jgi:hypothetical protein
MDNFITSYYEFVNEGKTPQESFEVFALNRLNGATKIAQAAKEKGGDAMLTYHHFNVKLPYYKRASEGKFDLEKTKIQLNSLVEDFIQATSNDLKTKQIEFQKMVGLIEVLGELIIRYNSNK